MKICLINNLYFPWARGGAENVVKTTYLELAGLGHEVFLISTRPKKQTPPEISDPFTYYLSSNYYNLSKKTVLYRFFWQIINLVNLKKYYQIKRILKKEKPELIISNNLMGLGLISSRLPKKLKIKHVHILHDLQLLHPSGLIFYKREQILDSLWARMYQTKTKRIINTPDLIISPSRWLMEEHLQRGFFKNSKLEILENPISPSTATPNIQTEEDRWPSQKIWQFLFAGQIEEHKGIIFLINTLKKLNRDDFLLTIIGDGSKLEEAKELVGDSRHFAFLGFRANNEVQKLMAKSDALIIPSLVYENSPTIIYEALANNLITIGAKIGGIPELISKYGGLLFEPSDSYDLLTQIKHLLNNFSQIKKDFPKEEISTGYAKKIIQLINQN